MFGELSEQYINEVIRKVGSQWFVFNKEGTKKLSKGYSSKEDAVTRLRQIEYFKNRSE